jgi:hypothetical protein
MKTCKVCGIEIEEARTYCSYSCRNTGVHGIEFEYRISESGCWECTSHKPSGSKGYIEIWIHGKRWIAHRYFYTMFKGNIPKDLIVMHSCDNRRCVNPDHLSLGSLGENNTDRHKKGRSSVGESRPASKLTEEDVIAIREEKILSISEIAKKYKMSYQSIWRIVKKISWSYLEKHQREVIL